jgi:hypothetical protein
MVMGTIFRKLGSDRISSFSYDEIVSATGIVNLYAVRGGAGAESILTPNTTIQGVSPISGGAVAGGGTSLVTDIDFDLLVNRQVTLKGATIVNFSVQNTQNTNDIYGIVYVRKWDGATETDLASDQSGTQNLGVEALPFSSYLDIPETVFKVGEYIRLSVVITTTSSNTANIYLAHDPSDSVAISGWTATTSQRITFPMPTKIVE